MRELRAAWRRLARAPAFTSFAIVTLGLGIGVTTAAYSGFYTHLGRPLGVRDSGSLVLLTSRTGINPTFPEDISLADFRDLSAQTQRVRELAAWGRFGSAIVGGGTSQLAAVEAVTGKYFSVLGVSAALGRVIQPADAEPGAPPVVVLADSLWRSQFGGDPAIVGSTVRIANQPVEVIGVAPEGFRGVGSRFVGSRSAWMPLPFAQRLPGSYWRDRFDPGSHGSSWLYVVGRLMPGLARDAAAVDIATVGARLDEAVPLRFRSGNGTLPTIARQWTLTALDDSYSVTGSAEVMRVVVGLPLLVLLVACTNLANLVLSRGIARRHEFAVRSALGASRWRLVREEIIEGATIVLAGGAVGAVVAQGLLTWAVSRLREVVQTIDPTVVLAWRVQPVVFVAVAIAACLALLVAAVLPAIQLTRPRISGALAVDNTATSAPRWRGRGNLIALQVTATAALCLVTLLCVRLVGSAMAHGGSGGGADLERMAVAVIPFDAQQYPAAQIDRSITEIVADVRRSPNVEAAGAITHPPIGLRWSDPESAVAVSVPDMPLTADERSGESAHVYGITPGMFRAMGQSLLAGRSFDDRDRAGSAPVVILEEQLAQRMFGRTDVVGRPFAWRQAITTVRPAPTGEATIVGVVSNTPLPEDGREADLLAYAPIAQRPERVATIVARAAGPDARPIVAAVVEAIRRTDPDIAITSSGRADTLADGLSVVAGFIASCCGGLALLSLALAMAGLYGVLSHIVSLRTREMGLRMALGADGRDLVRLVMKGGLRPVLEGLVIGLLVAFVIRQVMVGLFTRTVSPIDAAMLGAAFLPLVVAGVVTCYLPARRASRVDPNVALRDL